ADSLSTPSFDETADKHFLACSQFRSATKAMKVARTEPFGSGALRMRSTMSGESDAEAGDHRSESKETTRAVSLSRSGCKLFQAMDGMILSCPQLSRTSARTGSESKSLILREAMATWSWT